MISARSGLDSPKRHTFTRRRVRYLACDFAIASPQFNVALSCNQSHGSPVVEFSPSVPLIIFALPDATSATHSSMPLSFVLRNERCVPSGEKCTFEKFACGGAVTFTSLPSEMFLRVTA